MTTTDDDAMAIANGDATTMTDGDAQMTNCDVMEGE